MCVCVCVYVYVCVYVLCEEEECSINGVEWTIIFHEGVTVRSWKVLLVRQNKKDGWMEVEGEVRRDDSKTKGAAKKNG